MEKNFWKSIRPNWRPLCIAFHSEKLTFLLHLLRIFRSVGFLKGLNQLHVQKGSMANNFQQIWTLRKSIRPNLRPLCIAFHSEKFTFLLHLLRIFLSVGFLQGSNWLRIQEKSIVNNFQQIWTLWMSISPNLRPLDIAFYSKKLTFLLHLSRIFLSVDYLKGSNWLRIQKRSITVNF